jgi:hypothetical protein
MTHRRAHRRRALTLVSDDQSPEARIDGVGTVAMSDEQHTTAVHALAVLIENWRACQTDLAVTEPAEDRPLAA